ncbi:class II fructose-bisphosphate aldolase [Amycolatopsis rubida]|uniref:class II fructose-bisphosphate aldolase n=1 Tax=Amycolatopsis rubida TaxID=112413 RepID=UPI001FCA7F01|nr:class II fructose-bisphosphate aldolase [Amycolatopsis rubida]
MRRKRVDPRGADAGGKDGVHAPDARTDPAEAADFVTATGADALAVAAGTSRAMVGRTAQAGRALVARLRDAVLVPLVLHGSSGLPDEELRGAVVSGTAKVTISTHLNGLFTRSVRQFLEEQPDAADPRNYLRLGMASETARLLRSLAELRRRAWREVNESGIDHLVDGRARET